MKRLILVLTAVAIATANLAHAEVPPTMVWDATYDSGNDDIAWDIAVDAEGSVYAAGTVDNRVIGNVVNLDWLIIKYDAYGDTLWTRTWDSGNGDDETRSIAADLSGNVYASGWFNNGTDRDLRLVKYDTSGNLLWERTRDSGGDDWGNAVTVDDAGDVYLAGREGPGIWPDRFYYAKYDPQGGMVWEKHYDVENYAEGVFGIDVDAAGFVYMQGIIFTGIPGDGYDLLTLKCDAQGETLWSKIFDTGRGDYVAENGIAVDTAGNVYICGWSANDSIPPTVDWFVIKYDRDGDLEWNKIIDAGYDEGAQGITVDSEGYIYVTGPFGDETGYADCVTHKLDSDGNVVWESIYETARGHGVAIDDSGFVCISAHTNNGTDDDCLIIKYQQQQQVGVAEEPSASLVTFEVAGTLTTPTIRYSIPDGHHGTLTFYSVDGSKVETYALDPGRSDFVWAARNTPSGIYFARLVSANIDLTKRLILVR